MTRAWRSPLCAVVLAVPGCLQVEEPPPAGALVVQVTTQGLEGDFTVRTDDGWTLTLKRALLSLGEVRLMGEGCDQYSENQYLRVLDLKHAAPQRLVLVYALGRCEIGFLVRMPASDAVLGAGVDDATRAFLRAPGGDPFVTNEGIALHVEGTAERDGAAIRFGWSFRQAFDYSCGRVQLEARRTETVELLANLDRLFASPGADTTRFDAFAAADENDDAEVTLEELAAAPPSDGQPFGSLGEELYFGAMPRVLEVPSPARCDFGRFEEETGEVHR